MATTSDERDKHERSHARSVAAIVVLALAAPACGGGSDAPPVDSTFICTGVHDEDVDGIVDPCDNCPTVANPTQADTTEVAVHAFEDGVGDACDYRPGLSGDVLARLYTWSSIEQASNFTGTGWTIDATADTLTTTGAARWQATRSASGDGLIVVARVTALDLTSTGGLQLSIDGNGISAGDTCTLRATGLVAEEISGASMTKALSGVDLTQPYTVVAWRRVLTSGPELACRVEQGSRRTEVIIPLVDDLVIGAYGFASDGPAATLSSVAVYTSPGPKSP
jgi:hypothetical protein